MAETPPGVVSNPGVKLEDVRDDLVGNECDGRGRESAAPRGYNAELLADAVLGNYPTFSKSTPGPWADNFIAGIGDVSCYVEVKTTIDQYPSGAYGRFRIWGRHHFRLIAEAERREDSRSVFLYLFLVYRVASGIEQELGKVVVPAVQVDEEIDRWAITNHDTMGEALTHTVSWRKLFQSLGSSIADVTERDTVDLTVGSASLQRAREHLDT